MVYLLRGLALFTYYHAWQISVTGLWDPMYQSFQLMRIMNLFYITVSVGPQFYKQISGITNLNITYVVNVIAWGKQ